MTVLLWQDEYLQHIFYNKMFCKHPIIGLGNYSILRNIAEYRSFFPIISIYDVSAYGGFVNIINQSGLLGMAIWTVYLLDNQRKISTRCM